MSRRRRGVRKAPTLATKVKALWHFPTFIDMINFHGGTSALGECHDEAIEWYEDLDASDRILMLLPRAHLKSTLFNVGKTLHRIYQDPNIRQFVGSATKGLSTAFIREIKSWLEDEWLQEYVWNARPHYKGRLVPERNKSGAGRKRWYERDANEEKVIWRADAIQVIRPDKAKEPTVVAGSIGSDATGFHYDVMTFDDILTFRNCRTHELREKAVSWIYDCMSVLDPPDFDDDLCKRLRKVGVPKEYARRIATVGEKLTILGTRYHREDYYGHIIANREQLGYDVYLRNIYKNGKDNAQGYLWDEVWDADYEKRIRAKMSVQRFASQYLNVIMQQEQSVLSWDCIHTLAPTHVEPKVFNGYAKVYNYALDEWVLVKLGLFIDPATSTSLKADFSCGVVGGVDSRNNVYIVDGFMERLNPYRLKDRVFDLVQKYGLHEITIETVGAYETFVYLFSSFFTEAGFSFNINKYHPGTQVSKSERIEITLQPVVNSSKLYLVSFLKADSRIQDQFTFFGVDSSVHDDFLDATSILCQKMVATTKKVQKSENRRKKLRHERSKTPYDRMMESVREHETIAA